MNKNETKKNDEAYILNLCDEVLGESSFRQHTFNFLRGDPGKNGVGRKLPVDSFYPSLKLVIEYKERQHSEPVPFFDKQHKITVSGVHRGEQRKLYDQRRREILSKNKIQLLELSYSDFFHNNNKRLTRNRKDDLRILRGKLATWIK